MQTRQTGENGTTARQRNALFPGACVALLIMSVWFYKFGIMPRPYWIATTDVELDMLVNSLLVASGQPIIGFWLPATPIYALGGIIGIVFDLGLPDAQALVSIGQIVIIALNALTLFILSWSLLRHTPFLLSTAVLLSFFINPAALNYLNYFSENGFILPVSTLILLTQWRSLDGRGHSKLFLILAAGFMVGFGFTIKMLLLPFLVGGLVGYAVVANMTVDDSPIFEIKHRRPVGRLLLAVWGAMTVGSILKGYDITSVYVIAPLAATIFSLLALNWQGSTNLNLSGLRKKLPGKLYAGATMAFIYLSGAMMGFYLATLPAVHLRLAMYQRAKNLVTRSGIYGGGDSATLNSLLNNFSANAELALKIAPLWSLLVVVCLSLLSIALIHFWIRSSASSQQGAVLYMAFGAALITSSLLGLGIALTSSTMGVILQHPGVVMRYLLPVAVCVMFGLILLTRLRRNAFSSYGLQWALSIPILVAALVVAYTDIRLHTTMVISGSQSNQIIDTEIASLAERLERPPKVLFVGSQFDARRSASLRHGDGYANGHFADELDRLYPSEFTAREAAFLGLELSQYDLVVLHPYWVDKSVLDQMSQLGDLKYRDVDETTFSNAPVSIADGYDLLFLFPSSN